MLLRPFEQLDQQRLGGRRLAFGVVALAVNGAQSLRAGELERQHAPRMAQRARFTVWPAHALDAALGVDLVEAQGDRERRRQLGADVLAKLPHRRHVRQRRRFPEQVVEGDQRVGLAAAVGQLQLPHRLVTAPGKPPGNVLHQLPQGMGRVGQREEFLGVFVDPAAALRQRHLVQVGRKLRQRQLAAAQLILEPHHFMPRPQPAILPHHSPP